MKTGEAPNPRPDVHSSNPGTDQQANAPKNSAAASVHGATSSNQSTDKELLCTICGLRACWQ